MANTIVKKLPYSVQVTLNDVDFVWATQGDPEDENPPLQSITFVPGANDDMLIVRDGSASGPIIFHGLCLNTDEKIQYYYGSRKRIYIDESECVHNAGHTVIIDIAKRN